jgi:hypothetical protein
VDVQQAQTLVGALGFPIVMSLILVFKIDNTLKQLTSTIEKLIEKGVK